MEQKAEAACRALRRQSLPGQNPVFYSGDKCLNILPFEL